MLKNVFSTPITCLILLVIMMIACAPKKPTVAELRAEKHASDSIALIQQRKSLAYYDSTLSSILPLIDPMLKKFHFEQQTQYEDHGHYVHNLLKTTSNTNRNFIQTYVLDNHTTLVRAYYYGASQIRLQSIELQSDSVFASFSGDAYAFQSEGWHETLTLQGEKAIELLQFINAFYTKRIRVALKGEKTSCYFVLSDNDKKSLMETYQLATIMTDIHELEKQVRQTSLQVEKYEKRLAK